MNAAVSIMDLARAIGGYSKPLEAIVALAAFFDDSGTHGPTPYVVFGGLLGTERQWAAFEAAWAALLKEPLPGKPPLRKFATSRCLARRGEFQGYSETERNEVIDRFNSVILDLGLVTVAQAVNKVAWDALVVGKVADELGPAEGLCFVKCLEKVIELCRQRKPGQPVAMIFDQGIGSRIEGLAQLYLTQSAIYPELRGIGFAKVEEILPLQGADIIANSSYFYAQESAGNPYGPTARKHFEPYILRDLSFGSVIERSHIEEIVARVQERMPHTR